MWVQRIRSKEMRKHFLRSVVVAVADVGRLADVAVIALTERRGGKGVCETVAANAFDPGRRNEGLVEAIDRVDHRRYHRLVDVSGQQENALALHIDERIDAMLRLLLLREPNARIGVGSIGTWAEGKPTAHHARCGYS